MLKRRTSKRFVIGDSNDAQNYEEEETEVIPASLVQKFQMTLDSEPDKNGHVDENTQTEEQNGKLLRPPVGTIK